jgi:hypothetical protein
MCLGSDLLQLQIKIGYLPGIGFYPFFVYLKGSNGVYLPAL